MEAIYNDVFSDVAAITYQAHLSQLVPALERLDGILSKAIADARTGIQQLESSVKKEPETDQSFVEEPTAYQHSNGAGPLHFLLRNATADPLISNDSLEHTACGSADKVGREALCHLHTPPNPDGIIALPAATENPQLAWLQEVFGLSDFDLDIILLALAPEIDRRYEHVYSYLQGDRYLSRPGVDLTLNLLCTNVAQKLARRVHFAPDAPLIKHHLIYLIPDQRQIWPTLLTDMLQLDGQIVRFLLNHGTLDPRLSSCCQLYEPHVFDQETILDEERQRALISMALSANRTGQPLRCYFQGIPGTGKRKIAEAMAAVIDLPFLRVDLRQAEAADPGLRLILALIFREAWFLDALLYLENLDWIFEDEMADERQALWQQVADAPGIVILAGTMPRAPSPSTPIDVLSVPFTLPEFQHRLRCWQDSLDSHGIVLLKPELETLAGCFRLTAVQISEAVAVACQLARWRTAVQTNSGGEQPTLDDLLAGARGQAGHELGRLARRIEPAYTWDDIVLPGDTIAQLRELCQRVAYRHQVLDTWGFGRKLSLGKGVTALFAGSSGTGKTMAAEVIANELGLDLYKIDLAGVVSKYIGETEKNLDHIFTAAENANAILFFDEADALFGKRSEVRDSHDRYANIEISYLLQKMEEYEGIAILATNLRQNLDEAFVRRLAFMVHFPFPDEESRRRIWQGIWPVALPLASLSAGSGQAVDLHFLARQFKLSGGNIRNIALAASFLAAEDGQVVTMAHLRQATRREYQKLGKKLSDDELAGEKV